MRYIVGASVRTLHSSEPEDGVGTVTIEEDVIERVSRAKEGLKTISFKDRDYVAVVNAKGEFMGPVAIVVGEQK
jgi:hypothetical protein